MSSFKSKVSGILVKATYQVAVKGAGMASLFGWYQPRVPDKLSK